MSLQPAISPSRPESDEKTADELIHAIRNQLGLIAGHASLLQTESAPESNAHQSAEIISRACFTVSDQLQTLAEKLPRPN